jgi:hypothetical protein
MKREQRLFSGRFPNMEKGQATTPVVISKESFTKVSKPRHFIGLGTAAGRFISKYSNLMDFDSFTIIDSIKPENSDIVVEFIWFDPNEFNSGHFQSKTTDILEILPVPGIIKDHLSGLQGGLVFFSCLGNVTGTLLFQSIGFGYKNLSENVQWFATTPFDFEGSRNAARSERAISIVKENQKDPICFSF